MAKLMAKLSKRKEIVNMFEQNADWSMLKLCVLLEYTFILSFEKEKRGT